MKSLVLGLVTAGLFGATASAADLPVKYRPVVPVVAVYNWTGCYIGGNVGGAWARQDANTVTIPAFDAAPGLVSLDRSSLIGGGQVGCEVQFGSIVLGVEGDFSGTRLGSSAAFPNLFLNGTPVGSGGIVFNRSTDWLASARGRLGFTVVPNVLLYATGGIAWTRTDYNGTDAFAGGCPNCAVFSGSKTSTGGVVGVGAEWMPWTSNWMIRAEYLYYHFSGASFSAQQVATPGLFPTVFTFNNLNISEFRLGLSYKFDYGGPLVARY